MSDELSPYTVDQHFTGCAPAVRAVYSRILEAARELGPVREEPKKTSIHLARKRAFAGVATRKQALVLTLKSATDLQSARIARHEQASANRWHLEIRLDDPAQVDGELAKWLADAFELAG
ncbi:MAG TPA: DUF5655 domain-containing protein [Thermoanaerobaculia bacterium]|jgi:hypothetical protein|nr:DUF5655 domain-containing protein [Thermoanaerobaculia bacterium]